MKKMITLVDELGIRAKVHFLGKQENLAELYSISDLFLLLSEKESFGLAALEAMACGVPCIGTDIGGIPEVIADGENGYVCPLGDLEAISTRAISLLTDPVLYKEFSKNALDAVHRYFSAERIVEEYEKVYYGLLGQVEE